MQYSKLTTVKIQKDNNFEDGELKNCLNDRQLIL